MYKWVSLLVLIAAMPATHGDDPLPRSFSPDVIRRGFHVGEKWPLCQHVFSRIRDQGECNACWAIAPADVLRDRMCIRHLYSESTSDFDREHFSHESFPNVSVTDVLSCARFSLKRTACSVGGRPQMAWYHFHTEGFLDEDPPHSSSEFAYYYPPCNHSIPSTAVWIRARLATRDVSSSSSTLLSDAEDDGTTALPFCRRRKHIPKECPPALGNRRRRRLISSAERIGGNTGVVDGDLDEDIMEELFHHGPVQASMGILPALATIPFGSMTRREEEDEVSSSSWYPFVYRCVASAWLKKLQDNPSAPENQRQNHAVRIVGWGSVPFNDVAFHRLFDDALNSTTDNSTNAVDVVNQVGGMAFKQNRPRKSNASPRSASRMEQRQRVEPPPTEHSKLEQQPAPNRRRALNRFRYAPTDIAVPDEEDDAQPQQDRQTEFRRGDAAVRWVDYWIVANSWGPLWGDRGFFYVQRGKNDCRLSHNAMHPVFT